jgi:hypothetical protein
MRKISRSDRFPKHAKLNWSKSIGCTSDVSSMTGDVNRDISKHKEVTSVTQFWHFWVELDQYKNDTWHCKEATCGTV